MIARDILLMQRSQLILGGLVIEPFVDRPPPLMNRRRILGAPAAWADVPDFFIEPRVILLDPLGQGVFLGVDLAGAGNIVLACRQMKVPIVLFDLLKIILGPLQVILGWLPMTDRSLHRSIAGRPLGVDLRLRSVHNGQQSIADLYQHNCIGMRDVVSGAIRDWELIDGKQPTAVKTSGTALVTDYSEALSLALAGVGIAYVTEPLARRWLREASLQWLLPQTAVERDGLFLYYPRRASLAPKLRAFIDVAKKTLKSFE